MKSYVLIAVSVCLLLTASSVDAAYAFTDPVPVEMDITWWAGAPCLSPDELTVYFFNFKDPAPESDIYFAVRPDIYSPFGAPSLVPGLSFSNQERTPWISPDGLTMHYTGGTTYDHDIWMATRELITDPFSNHTPLATINSSVEDRNPTLTADGLTIVFSSTRDHSPGLTDIYMSTRPDIYSSFSAPVNLTELNTEDADGSPAISSNGKIIFFQRESGPGSELELWMATRPNAQSPFSAPWKLDDVNSDGYDTLKPFLSYNSMNLYFNSDREGSLPGNVWMSRVVPEPSIFIMVLSGIGLGCFFRKRK